MTNIIFVLFSGYVVLEKVMFLNGCLVPRTRFIPACRERDCGNYHCLYKENMQSLFQMTGSHRTSAWLCLKLLEVLLNKNYPISEEKAKQKSDCREIRKEVRDIVAYISGSITTKLKQKYKRLKFSEHKLLCLD